jgi:hypothetical protein
MPRLKSTGRWSRIPDVIADTRGAMHPRTLVIGGVLGLLTCVGLSMLARSVDEHAREAVEGLDTPAPLPTLAPRR